MSGAAIIALIYLIVTLDTNKHRTKITALISRSLGHKIHIGGEIGLEASLWPRFVVEDVRIANPSWASVSDLATVKRWEIQVALLPLLSRNLEILQFNLIGADIHLERDQEGRPNWLREGPGGTSPPANVLPAKWSINIRDSRITWHVNDRPSISFSVDELEANLGAKEPFHLAGELEIDTVPLELSLSGGPLRQLLSPRSPWPFRGNMIVDALPIKLEGTLMDPVLLKEVKLQIAAGPDTGRLNSLFERRRHDIGDVNVNLEIKRNEAGYHILANSRASHLDLADLITAVKLTPVSGIRFESLESSFESEGHTVQEIILNSRSRLIAKQGEFEWLPGNTEQPKKLEIQQITMQAKPTRPVEVKMMARFDGVQTIVTLRQGRIVDLLWNDQPWPIEAHIQAAGVKVGVIAEVHPSAEKPSVTGTVKAAVARLEQIGTLFDREWITLGPASVTGEFVFANKRLQVSDMRGTIAGSALYGSMSLSLKEPFEASAHFQTKAFDLSNLMPWQQTDASTAIQANDVTFTAESRDNTLLGSILRTSWRLSAPTGHIQWWDQAEASRYEIAITDITVTSKQNQAIDVSLSAQHNDVGLKLDGKLGSLIELSDRIEPFPLVLKLTADTMTAEFNGSYKKPLRAKSLAGELAVQAEQVTTIARLLGNELENDQPLSLSARIDYNPQNATFHHVKLETPGLKLNGQGGYSPDRSPRMDATIENTVIDLAEFFRKNGKGEKRNPTPAAAGEEARIITDFPLSNDTLKRLSAVCQINSLNVMYASDQITTIDTRVSMFDGKLSVSPFQSHSPSGSSAKANFLLDTSVSPFQANYSFELNKFDYGLILKKMQFRKDVIGKLDFRLNAKGHGSSFDDMIANTSGDMEVVLDKGRTPRRILEFWGGDLVRLLIPTTWFEEDLTDLNCAVGRFEITNGVVQSKMLLSDTPRVTVAGEMMLDLNTEEVAGLFTPRNKDAALFRFGKPIKVSGTLSHLKAETTGSRILTLGKLVLGLSYPPTLILLFGDLGSAEKNPCEALLHQPLPEEAARSQH